MNITKIVETCLYSDDLEASQEFYSDFLGLKMITWEPGRHLFFRCGSGMLLIFNPEHTTRKETEVDDQLIPLHGSKGSGHIAFQAESSMLDEWRRRFDEYGIEIESEVDWPDGGTSIYFRDPSKNSVEIIFGNIWNV